jgi:hypothetical protein
MYKKISIIILCCFLFGVDYTSDIQPIFDSNCTSCHDNTNPAGGLTLLTYNDVINSNVVVPGNALSSELYNRIILPESSGDDMPPEGSLYQSQIDLISQWIDDGALFEEVLDVEGCTDPNAISCNDDIDTIYFPECITCSESEPCANYYNENATVDNDMCMYNDVPSNDEFITTQIEGGYSADWSSFTPPVEILQYTLQRCLDPDGDTDGDGFYEYENCTMLIPPMSFNLNTTYVDIDAIFELDEYHAKYTLYVHYPNNTYWGSANSYYYLEPPTSQCTAGDVNGDSVINVIDVISTVNHIIGNTTLEGDDFCAADINGDSIINVTDIISLINIILS